MEDVIGMIAGFIITYASGPRVCAVMKDPTLGQHEDVVRDGCFLLGNLIWLIYGLIVTAWPLIVFCGVNVMFNAVLLYYAFPYWKKRQ